MGLSVACYNFNNDSNLYLIKNKGYWSISGQKPKNSSAVKILREILYEVQTTSETDLAKADILLAAKKIMHRYDAHYTTSGKKIWESIRLLLIGKREKDVVHQFYKEIKTKLDIAETDLPTSFKERVDKEVNNFKDAGFLDYLTYSPDIKDLFKEIETNFKDLPLHLQDIIHGQLTPQDALKIVGEHCDLLNSRLSQLKSSDLDEDLLQEIIYLQALNKVFYKAYKEVYRITKPPRLIGALKLALFGQTESDGVATLYKRNRACLDSLMKPSPKLSHFNKDTYSNESMNLYLSGLGNINLLDSIESFDQLHALYQYADSLQAEPLCKAAIERMLHLLSINFDFDNAAIIYNLSVNQKAGYSDFKNNCLKEIASALFNQHLELPFPLSDKIENVNAFSDSLMPHLLEKTVQHDLRLFLELENLIHFKESKKVFREIKEKVVPENRFVKTKSGNVCLLLSDIICFEIFNFFHGDRIITNYGEGTVHGIGVDGNLWVSLDKDEGISYWGGFNTREVFEKKGFKILCGKKKSQSGVNINFDHYSRCFKKYGVFPGEQITTPYNKGIIMGMCHEGNLWVEFTKGGIVYLPTFFQKDTVNFSKELEKSLNGSEAQLYRLLRVLKSRLFNIYS